MTPEAPWDRRGMRLAFAFAAASLNFLPVWRTLLYATEAERYFIADRYPHDHAAAITLTLLLAAGILGILEVIRRVPGRAAWWLVLFLVGLCAIAPLNFARIIATRFGIDTREAAMGVLAAGVVLLPFLYRFRERVALPAFFAIAMFAPLAPLYLAQAVWGLATAPAPSEAPPPARATEPAAREGGPRVVWVLFDELDGRVLGDPNVEFEYPEFERLGHRSVQATRVVPPGGNTIRAMPAFWLGRPVSAGRPVSSGELAVQLDGEGERQVSELDHLYRKAFERGHTLAISGFYHPYCRMFGDLLRSCAGFAYSDVGHRETTGFLESLRIGSVALLPNWRRMGSTWIYEGVKSAGLGMVADPTLDFVTVHPNVPHDPPMYDPVAQELTPIGRRASYPSSILLADRMLGEIRRTVEDAGLAGRTHLVVTSDHGWKPMEGHDSAPGAIPLFVGVPGQQQGRVVEREIDAVVIGDLMLLLLDGEIVSGDQVERWLLARSRE